MAIETTGNDLSRHNHLNNFVTQLLHVPNAGTIDPEEVSFSNPRDGWVHFQVQAQSHREGSVELHLEETATRGPIIRLQVGGAGQAEGMRHLPRGEHMLLLRGATKDISVTITAIPEIIFANVPGDPTIKEFGSYSWSYLQRIGMLDSINVIISEATGDHIGPWLSRGKRLIQGASVPGREKETLTAEQAYEFWVDHPGLVQPQFSGIIVDEFDERVADKFPVFAQAFNKVKQARKGRGFYPYIYGDTKLLAPLVSASMKSGCRYAYLRYLKEQPDEEQARREIERQLKHDLLEIEKASPGFINNTIVVLGLISAPPLTLNANPGTSYKTYLDMQFHQLATDPQVHGLYGIEMWTCTFADEEYLRWTAKLFRHYCIEGHTDRLTNDPYVLEHIRNPEFAQGLDSWSVQAAAPGSVAARTLEGLGWLQGRWPQDAMGDTFAWTRRSVEAPNLISQTIGNLKPGRTYSAKALFGDYADLSEPRRDAISMVISGADPIVDRSFQAIFKKTSSHTSSRFDKPDGYFGFVRQVFRATSETAQLTISDWASEQDPGNPVEGELMINFIEVEPYFMED